MNLLEKFNAKHMKSLLEGRTEKAHIEDRSFFRPGDTLCVYVRIKEGEKERVQRFEGVCIARYHRGLHSSFLVRRTTAGSNVERVFPLYHPNIERVECLRHGRVRRGKLYYLRHLSGKKARIAEKRTHHHTAAAAQA